MAEEIKTTDDLRRLFGQYPQIATLIESLSGDIAHINQLNLTAGGKDDETAENYNKIAGLGTQVLDEVAKMLRDMTATTGEGGENAMKVFDAAEEDAKHLSTTWDKLVDAVEELKAKQQKH